MGRGPRRAVALGLLLLAGCGGGEGTGPVTPPSSSPPPPPAPTTRPMFSSPIAGTAMQEFFFGSYKDQGGMDYSCGFKWYAGHQGVDILLRNFRVQDSGVAVIAAAPGTVVETRDGQGDRNIVNGSGGFGNYVLVEHEPGAALAYYGHMRRGSIRVVRDATVKRGDTLGLVGSSGNSNWPHLHFEVSDRGQVLDPFLGPCNPPLAQPTWLNQLPWQGEFAVLDAGISRTPLSFGQLLERPADAATIAPADNQVVFWASLLNIQASATRTVLRDPAGTVLGQVTTGTFTTFSTRFLVATFNVAGLLTSAGEYSIALSVPTPTGSEVEVVRRTFRYDPGITPGPQRTPGRGPAVLHTVWLSPDAGERP